MIQRSLLTIRVLVACFAGPGFCAGCGTQIGIVASPSDLFVEVGSSRAVNVLTVMDTGAPEIVTDPLIITSDDEMVAEVNAGSVTGVAVGTALLTITDGTFTTTANVIVVEAGTLPTSLVVAPESITCTPDSPDVQLATFAVLTSGTSVDITDKAMYGSNSSNVALVTAEGTVVCVSPGNAQIAVQYLGLGILINVIVQPIPPASLNFVPNELLCEIGDQTTVQVFATSSDGIVTDVTTTAGTVSDSPSVATMDSGRVDCLTEGTAVIGAEVSGVVGLLRVDVVTRIALPNELVRIEAAPQAVICGVTQRAPFSVLGELGNGTVLDVSNDPQLVYESFDSNVVLILNNEPVCVQSGQTSVLIRLGALEATADVAVQ